MGSPKYIYYHKGYRDLLLYYLSTAIIRCKFLLPAPAMRSRKVLGKQLTTNSAQQIMHSSVIEN